MSQPYGIGSPVALDDVIERGMAKAKTVKAIFEEIAKEPRVQKRVQHAIDHPPQTHKDGKIIAGPNHTQVIRAAIREAIDELVEQPA